MNWAEPFTLQSAAEATGNGTKFAVNGRGAVNIAISGTFVGTITFEASHDGTDFVAVPALNRTTGVSGSTATAPGLFYIALPGIYFVRARISAYTSGQITAIGVAVDMMAPPNETVTLNGSDIEIGAVELKDGSTDTRGKVGVGTAIAESDNAVAVKDPVTGVTTGVAVTTDANGTIQQYLRGIVKLLVAGALSLVKAEDAAHASGDVGVAVLAVRRDTAAAGCADGDYATMNVDAVGQLRTTNPDLVNFGAGEYETIAASQTDQMAGATGAVGDFLAGLLVIPETTSPGGVSIEDGATNIPVFIGGTDSVSNLVPFYVPLGIKSVSGGWEITTGANVRAIAIGNFT